ncbi:MAG: ORF6N domain-containing protein [Candidatus Omnitrophica bacterium]|nr:ORF6N domain-containing protein [Candidatus Omnitrophota bacterium]MCB9747298.1 ORF6N domain-containing protein [Candidatus Omnitrophota bacterium]
MVPKIIENKIFLIRGKKIMLDRDLAKLYGVETKRLNEQVKRNIKRFPNDFMFQLTKEETIILMSQIVTSNHDDNSRSQNATLKRGKNIKYLPYAFTENGVAMLSSVLNSEKAINVNIQIMRAFTKLRELMSSHKELKEKIENLERKFKEHDKNFVIVFEAIRKLLDPPEKPNKKIGFHT